MSNQKTTRRLLTGNIMILLICIAMLILATYAWFTDSASTAGSKIQAGNLKVDIVDAENTDVSLQGQELTWVKAAGQENEAVLWEPGATYSLQSFRIKNNGNLALKYKLSIGEATGDTELLDVLKFTVTSSNGEAVQELNLDEFEGYLSGDNSLSDAITITAKMDENAGNAYQGKSISGISVTVAATQYTAESDSKSNQYDANASYPVTSASDLKTQLENGGNVVLGSDVAEAPDTSISGATLVPVMTVAKDTSLNLSGKTISYDPASYAEELPNYPVMITVKDNATLTIDGDGTINPEAGNNGSYGISVIGGGKLVINSGYFYGAPTAVQLQDGTLEINGGFFDLAPTCKAAGTSPNYIINALDSYYQNGTAVISIKGGTFVNFDPSANPEGAGTSYVAEGYKVTSQAQENGEIWYSVVPE